MSELKPCPFCGETATLDYSVLPNGKHWFITCDCCGMMYQDVTSQRKYVKDDWNTRPIEDALNARIAELERDVKWREESISTIEHALANNEDDIEMLESRIAELEEKQRWRVVANGELPNKNDYYLARDDLGQQGMILFYDGEWNKFTNLSYITLWMPLPEVQE